ncbi:MAG: pyruvate ferredoxin oxidoreductase [Candidatus Hermodarchaeia archaeon]|jgi:pyruvate ferredoxin oxidoreductase alpha subunit
MAIKQHLMGINGDEAVAYAAKHALVDVCAAYPITPQTIIVEKFAEFVANGEVETEFVNVESEHSALSACVGAAAAGARTFTASAANGIELMHEVIFLASSIRMPIVMAVADRAPSQEAYDATLQAFRIGEHPDVQLPVMTMLDGFVLTHTLENVYLLDEKDAHKFVGRREPMMIEIDGKPVPLKLDPKNPITIGPLQLFDYYMETKLQHSEAMERARPVITQINDEWAQLTGRKYGDGYLQPFKVKDADAVLVTTGSSAGTARYVARQLRAQGKKVGLLKVRTFRPFPYKKLVRTLADVPVVGVFERTHTTGSLGGPLFTEVRSALYEQDTRPTILGYYGGLGGRDVTPNDFEAMYKELLKVKTTGKAPRSSVKYVTVRK